MQVLAAWWSPSTVRSMVVVASQCRGRKARYSCAMIEGMVEREMVYEVELHRVFFPDDPEDPVSWSAEWAPQGSDSATEDNTENLADLVAAIVGDIRAFARQLGRPVRVHWQLSGDAPAGGTIADAMTAEGVILPDRVLPA